MAGLCVPVDVAELPLRVGHCSETRQIGTRAADVVPAACGFRLHLLRLAERPLRTTAISRRCRVPLEPDRAGSASRSTRAREAWTLDGSSIQMTADLMRRPRRADVAQHRHL